MGCFSFLVPCLKKRNGGRDDILESLKEQFVFVTSFSHDVFISTLRRLSVLLLQGEAIIADRSGNEQ